MKLKRVLVFFVFLLLSSPAELFPQSLASSGELGLSVGGLSNFPANQDYLNKYYSVLYVSPYIRVGQHEFSLGIDYPLPTKGVWFSDNNMDPKPGVVAGYKFYVFDARGRENMFVHYVFQYLRFRGKADTFNVPGDEVIHWDETDTYINNVIGLGYNLFFDMDERFSFFYILDYVISQQGYKLGTPGFTTDSWTTKYVWNNLSNQVGFRFRLTSLKKKK